MIAKPLPNSIQSESTRAYVRDMVEQLATMAAENGDHATAEALRAAVRVGAESYRSSLTGEGDDRIN